MVDYSIQNKKAWEYNAYEFWVKQSGTPEDRAKKDLENPIGMLKRYADYFDTYRGIKIANICGSCGKKADPLAVLGADVTVFDISEDNKKYALEVAAAAKVHLNFEVCDILDINIEKYGNYFDVVFMEGGVLHYFQMAHARFWEDHIRAQMPKCSYRKYTISEIVNSVINSGFTLKKFDEHPAWTNENVPGEFTIEAMK